VLRAIGIEIEPLPPHLRGVPPSLHKYEPLLKKNWLAHAPERERV
jgi:hypothetical protein